jgi:hypothetical protein
MKNFRIVPLSKEYTDSIRQSGTDHFGNKVLEQVATGFGPCRLSLRPFEPGKDKRLLFSHSPFEINNAFDQRGPIFINKEDVEPYADLYNFPAEIKADKKNFPLTLIGYSREQQMVYTKLVGDKDVDELIVEIFERRSNIAYLHARNAEAGCFICKIERNDTNVL